MINTKEIQLFLKKRQNLPLLVILSISAILYISIVFQYKGIITSIDGISYMSISQQYAAWDIGNAINAFWSPFISWLMVPLLWFGLGPTTALLSINFLTAMSILIATSLVIRSATNKALYEIVALLSLLPLLLSAISIQTPDLLVVSWVIWFTYFLIRLLKSKINNKNTRLSNKQIVQLALIGALGYFIKQFLIPYFIFSIFFYFIYSEFVVRGARIKSRSYFKSALRSFVLVLALYLLILSPWILALSLKYDRFTIGSSFEVNIGRSFGELSGEINRYIPRPPHDSAVSYGEDRTPREINEDESMQYDEFLQQVDIQEQSNEEFKNEKTNTQKIKDYAYERVRAFPFYINKLNSISPYIFISLISILVLLAYGKLAKLKHHNIHLVAILLTTYFFGYAMITYASSYGGNSRYYWPQAVLSVIVLLFISSSTKIRNITQKIFLLLILISIPLASFAQHGFNYSYPFYMSINVNSGTDGGYIINPLKRLEEPGVNIMSRTISAEEVIPRGARVLSNVYRPTVAVAFMYGFQAYGVSGRDYKINDDYLDIYRDHKIDYFIRYTPVWKWAASDRYSKGLVASYKFKLACEDYKAAPIEDCRVDIFKL